MDTKNHITNVSDKGNILVMDSDEGVRTCAAEILVLAGYGVELAKDGAEAITLYKRAKESGYAFNVVILDLQVDNGMGAKETLRNLTEIDPDVKAIVSSGSIYDPLMMWPEAHGFSRAVPKPYTMAELIAVVEAAICEMK